jgi:hypothetical protein
MKDDIEKLFHENQTYVETLQDTIKDINDNKEREEQKIYNYFEDLIKFLHDKREEMMEIVNNFYATNAEKLTEKLENFTSKMEEGENLKANILAVSESSTYKLPEVLHSFNQFVRDSSDTSKLNLDLINYKFAYEDQNKVINYLTKITDLKSAPKQVRFGSKSTNSSQQQFNPVDFKCLNIGKNILININKNNNEPKYNYEIDSSGALDNSEIITFNQKYALGNDINNNLNNLKLKNEKMQYNGDYATIGSSK